MIKNFNKMMKDDSGLGTIELVLLIVVLVGLAVLFKESIHTFFKGLTAEFNVNETIKDLEFK